MTYQCMILRDTCDGETDVERCNLQSCPLKKAYNELQKARGWMEQKSDLSPNEIKEFFKVFLENVGKLAEIDDP